MPTPIEKEIEQVADSLVKSAESSPREKLFETIRKLGPEGIRAKLPTLEKAEQELLLSALQEMKKAVEMDKDYAASYVKNKADASVCQEDKADDNQDEKLVKPEAATIAHQGTPTPGWEGQVIKGKDPKDKAKDAILAMEEKEHGTKDPKKLVAAEKKEHAMKKSDAVREAKKKVKSGDKDKIKEGLREMKKAVEEHFGADATPELVKGEMKKLLAEEDQDGKPPEMDEKTRANKEAAPFINNAKANKEAQEKVNDLGQGTEHVKKAVWAGPNDLLRAGGNGQNYHFSYEGHVIETAKQVVESLKPSEPMKKSEGAAKKDDLNDIIEKSQDATWDHISCERQLEANKAKVSGKFTKSFSDDAIAEALGLTPEEAKKLLGEK